MFQNHNHSSRKNRDRHPAARRVAVVVVALALILAGAARADEPEIKILPSPVDRGTPARVMVEGLTPADGLEGTFADRPIFFFAIGKKLIGLFGADVTLSPGRYPLKLTWTGGEAQVEVAVRDRSYGVRSISVPKNQVQLSKADRDRAARERQDVVRALATKSPRRLWQGPWTDPVGGGVTSAFGRQTRINGILNPRPHGGTDFDAAEGTPVKSPADGVVILTGDHFFAGRSVYLDHGQGVVSMYFHLSQIKVETGARIRRGDLLGLSGSTGRVDGAHLHYGIYICQARIDPVAFHRLTALLPRQ